MAKDRIETLIEAGNWTKAQKAIEKQLRDDPDDHWLWARLSGVKYEQRDYQGAFDDAKKALEIVPDCPLALWSYAGALDMLGKTKEAGKVYMQLFRRGVEELTTPDEDANECWEGADWTRSLIVDCIFRLARCLEKLNQRREAVTWYGRFLGLLDYGRLQGIYTREDAVARLDKLRVSKKAIPDPPEMAIKELEKVMG
jgi:tetratricopeptide (TPR) repeat protein